MPQLIGKFVRKEGTQIVFGSQKKPEWGAMEIGSGAYESAQSAEYGKYYQIDVDHNTVMAMRPAPPRENPRVSSGGGAPSRGRTPEDDLFISVLALAKSHIEHSGTMPPPEHLVQAAQQLRAAVKRFSDPGYAGAPAAEVDSDIPF